MERDGKNHGGTFSLRFNEANPCEAVFSYPSLTCASPDKAAHFHFELFFPPSPFLQKQVDVVHTELSSQQFITAQIQVISNWCVQIFMGSVDGCENSILAEGNGRGGAKRRESEDKGWMGQWVKAWNMLIYIKTWACWFYLCVFDPFGCEM